jgi:protein-S-isoprenylcysteine O-methyltransferase Ste14
MRSGLQLSEHRRIASTRETAGVIAPPPLVFFAAVLSGVALHSVVRAPVVPPRLALLLGVPLVAAALLLVLSAVREFRRAGTPVPTREPSLALVTTGPYRFSRNPIYLSMGLLHLGIALWANSAWILLTLVVALYVILRGVIVREERYLERRFGTPYVEYKASVRRWF